MSGRVEEINGKIDIEYQFSKSNMIYIILIGWMEILRIHKSKYCFSHYANIYIWWYPTVDFFIFSF